MAKVKKQIRFRKGSKRVVSGQVIGDLTVVQRVRDNVKATSPNLKVQYLADCKCGRRITVPRYYLVRENPKQNCGKCGVKSIKMQFNQEYRCWLMMHYRTENPKHESYTHYRDRGITVHPRFHKSLGTTGFEAWLAEIGPRPSRDYSCDRINNTRGYEPGNIRWATASQQRANQGNRIDGVLIVDDANDELVVEAAGELIDVLIDDGDVEALLSDASPVQVADDDEEEGED